MTAVPKAVICWSGGKDCAWALHEVRRAGLVDLVGAITTLSDERDRIAMHDVPAGLLRRQLDAARLPGIFARLPWPCPNAAYEAAMAEACRQARALGATQVVFGDLFLSDIRAYREQQLAGTGLEPIFPLWNRPTAALAHEMIDGGLAATLATVDLRALDAGFAGRRFDATLLADLPQGVDPCGENGEFHSFVTAGPMLAESLEIAVGPVRIEAGFAYVDLSAA